MNITVAVITAWDPSAEATTTLYVSNVAYTTSPTDTPADTSFLERLSDVPSFRQDMFDAALTSGRSRAGVGRLAINNADHELDAWLAYYYAGREIAIYQGAAGDAFPGSWTQIAAGRMMPPDTDQNSIRISLRDVQQRLAVPLQTARYAGDNSLPDGLEGMATDIGDKPKPVLFGRCLNIAPPCVNTSKLIYQVHDGEVHGITVYDSGLELTIGGYYTSEADLLDEDLAPAAGEVKPYLAGGYFRLGSIPAGLVTADATRGGSASVRTAAQLFADVAENYAGLSAGEWSAADVTAVDTLNSASLGFWSGLSPTSCAFVADQLMQSIGGWWGADELGVLRLGVLTDPTSGTAALTITSRTVDATNTGPTLQRVLSTDSNQGVPSYRVVVGYARNWTVQDSGVVGAVDQDRRTRLGLEYLEAVSVDTDIQTAHPIAWELHRDTLINTSADAQAESGRLLAMLRHPAETYRLTTAYDPTNLLRVGDVVRMSNDYFNMTTALRFTVIKQETRPLDTPPSQVLTLWRPSFFAAVGSDGSSTATASLSKVHSLSVASAGAGSASATGFASTLLERTTASAGAATTSATAAASGWWGYNGTSPSANSNFIVSEPGTKWGRVTGGQFKTGGSYRLTTITIEWVEATGSTVRIGLYTNSSLDMDGSTLVYDHGELAQTNGAQDITITEDDVLVDGGDYLFIAAKTESSDLRWRAYTGGGAGDMDGRSRDSAQTDETLPWADPSPTSWDSVTSGAVMIAGVYYERVS